jgi:glycerol-3-phosphate dehydrogenase (NAD(P)+)
VIVVIGAGGYGAALAIIAADGGNPVTLLARDAQAAARIAASRESPHLPGIKLDDAIAVTGDKRILREATLALLCVPSQATGEVLAALAGVLPKNLELVLCAKGVERATLRLQSEIALATAPQCQPLVLSGPSFDHEVARRLPTAVALAAADLALARRVAKRLASPSFRPYASDDLVGVQIGGAAKNVIAIACGIVIGRGLGDNARAALMTRSLAELTRLAVALGGRAETLSGLSGLGDLILTCNNTRSRNLSFGIALGEGLSPQAAQARIAALVEGLDSTAALAALAARAGIEMPIVAAVDAILNQGAAIDATLRDLFARRLTTEI